MRDTPACPLEDHLRAIALARLILSFDVHLQAPPNLTDTEQLGTLLGAGIDDWGGVSPDTADHVNPERPWPALRTLRSATEDAGHALVPRLTIYPEFALDPARWLDPAMRFPFIRDSTVAHGCRRCPAPLVIQRVDQWAVMGGSPRPRATPGPVRADGPRRGRTTCRVRRANGPARP